MGEQVCSHPWPEQKEGGQNDGCAPRQEGTGFQHENKVSTGTFVCNAEDAPIMGHVIFKTKKVRGLLGGTSSIFQWLRQKTIAWSNTETTASFVKDIGVHLCQRDTEEVPHWIFLLDCATVHMSAAITAVLRDHAPNVCTKEKHRVQPTKSSIGHNQPLDIT
eukprot:5416649-Amphidinium_carterae.1